MSPQNPHKIITKAITMVTMTAFTTVTTPIRPAWHAIVSACMTHSSGTSHTDGMTLGMIPGTVGTPLIITTAMPAGTIGAGVGDGIILTITATEAGTTGGIIPQAVGQRPAAIWDNVRQPSTDGEAAALAMAE